MNAKTIRTPRSRAAVPRSSSAPRMRAAARLLVLGLAAAAAALAPASNAGPVEEHRNADPRGEVEIVDVAGSVEVAGWDRNEVEVKGKVGEGVDRVEVNTTGSHTSIHVISHDRHLWGSNGAADLVIHVPAGSSIDASLVSADFKIAGIQGNLKLQTVSGEVKGEVGGNVHATSVSGDVRLTARAATTLEVKTTSGDLDIKGGGGDVEATTVSGVARLDLGEVAHGRFHSVSGDIQAHLGSKGAPEIEGETVSGNLSFDFAAPPGAEIDLQTFSGDIDSCFGPKPNRAELGPGTRLRFSSGDGRGHIRITSKSGDLKLCAAGARREAADARRAPLRLAMAIPYVI